MLYFLRVRALIGMILGVVEYVIGVDSGTQSTKAVVVDRDSGRVVGSAVKRYSLIEGLPQGHREQHPSIWVEALVETVRRSIEESSIDPRRVKALGVSGQQHGFVPLENENNVIRPAKLWNDTSTVEECHILIDALGGRDEVIRLIGNSIPPRVHCLHDPLAQENGARAHTEYMGGFEAVLSSF